MKIYKIAQDGALVSGPFDAEVLEGRGTWPDDNENKYQLEGSTSLAPPEKKDGFTRVFADGAWEQRLAPIPDITPRQIRLAMTQAGIRSQVEAYVAAASQDVKDTWEFATIIERDNAIIVSGAAALGMTDAQIDDLFALASTL